MSKAANLRNRPSWSYGYRVSVRSQVIARNCSDNVNSALKGTRRKQTEPYYGTYGADTRIGVRPLYTEFDVSDRTCERMLMYVLFKSGVRKLSAKA